MPIGWDTGGSTGGSVKMPKPWTKPDSVREAGRLVARQVIEQVPRWELMQRGRSVAEWVLEWTAERYPVAWHAWQVHADERLCPECSIYAGDSWEADTWHPSPPLHVNCRCDEVLDRIEWRTRYVETWRLRYKRVTWWEWEQTGWDQTTRTEWEWRTQ